MLTQQYPTGETVTPSYSSTGWLTGLNTSAGGSTALASNLAYTGLSGAAGRISSMSLGNGTYSYTASYDTGIRLTSAGLSTSSGNTVLYQTQPTYDAVNNVVGVQTSVGGQTDTQQFCYDDLNRLTWSGTNGTPPCSGQSIVAGTLTTAQYQQSNTYTVESGLVTGPSGNYTYGDGSHPHAVTSTSKGYSAAYDASGNMLCRATTTATTCSGSSPTGQQLSYDAEGRLSLWQNQPTSPTQTVNSLYDGFGNRVAKQSTVSGTTTLTSYIGSIEEVQTRGSTTQTTTYYAIEGKRVAADVNGTFYYFGYDALGSQVAVLNAAGSLVGAQLYGPYGNSRYNNGTLPTSIGFTGQRADSVTGLDYYVARYYDPNVGQFVSADSVQGNAKGMNPYAYVGGNPETRTDPTGNFFYNPGSGEGARFPTAGGPPSTFQYNPPQEPAPYGGGCPSHGYAPAGCGGGTADGYTSPAHGYLPPTPTQVVAIAHSFTQHKPPVFGQPGSSMTPLLYEYLFHYQTFIRTEAALNQEGLSMYHNLVHDAFQFMNEVDEVDWNLWNLNDDTIALFRHVNALRGKAVPIGMRTVNEFGGLDEGGLCGGGLSFEANTKVATAQGEQAIGTLKVGEKVLAYNPKSHKMELQPIVHVWINHDNDLVDLTLTVTLHSSHGTLKKSEVLHTNKRHPFLTMEQSFVPVSRITRGMHVVRANGSVGVVTGWSVVAGTKTMYNLEVAQDHTFTVGDGQWVCITVAVVRMLLLIQFKCKRSTETIMHQLSGCLITIVRRMLVDIRTH